VPGSSGSSRVAAQPEPRVIVVTATPAPALPTAVAPTQTPYIVVVTATPSGGAALVAPTATPVVPATTPAPAPAITAVVFQGGELRSIPAVEGSGARDRIVGGETVTLRERTADGQWFAVADARGKEGWVHAGLLRLAGVAVDMVPVSAEAAAVVAPVRSPEPVAAPALIAAPEHVEHGMVITLSGAGWPARAQLALMAGLERVDPSHDLGSVQAGADGRWLARVRLGDGQDGKPLPSGRYRIVASTFAGDAVAAAQVELVP
jgi:hypothetical protein